MRTIAVPTREQVDSKSQQIFDQLKGQLGMVPNLYATIGYSSDTLENFLQYSGKAGKASFSNKEIEAIKLAVSEVNGCEYCLAAHTAIGKMNGFTEEETLQLRDSSISDPKLKVLTSLAREVALTRGKANGELVENFFQAGYDEKALIDFISVVIEISFTNFTHNLTKIPVDFPKAQALKNETV